MWPILFASIFGWILAFRGSRRMLAAVVVILPLLGLLGTVTGMLTTFEVIQSHGTGEPRLLAGGIREALITTEAGLIMALPLLIVHQTLRGKA